MLPKNVKCARHLLIFMRDSTDDNLRYLKHLTFPILSQSAPGHCTVVTFSSTRQVPTIRLECYLYQSNVWWLPGLCLLRTLDIIGIQIDIRGMRIEYFDCPMYHLPHQWWHMIFYWNNQKSSLSQRYKSWQNHFLTT